MVSTYEPEVWRELFVTLGTTAGALVGLLFVVMSLHLDKIGDMADANVRVTVEGARYNAYHLLSVFVEAVVLLTPQPLWLMGLELAAINLFGLRLPFTIIAKYADKRVTISERGRFPAVLIVTIITAYVLGAAGGAMLVSDQVWGLYLVVAACVIKIVRAALTAWMLMFAVQVQSAAQGPRAPRKPRITKV